MENEQSTQQISNGEAYNYAANLMVYGKKNSFEVQTALFERGIDERDAMVIINTIEDQISAAKKKKAQKDMLYGALWCVGGIVLTIANIGFIFWGAIIFGGIQFFRGLSNLNG